MGFNILLAGIALFHWPGSEQLELVNDPDGYQVCCRLVIPNMTVANMLPTCLPWIVCSQVWKTRVILSSICDCCKHAADLSCIHACCKHAVNLSSMHDCCACACLWQTFCLCTISSSHGWHFSSCSNGQEECCQLSKAVLIYGLSIFLIVGIFVKHGQCSAQRGNFRLHTVCMKSQMHSDIPSRQSLQHVPPACSFMRPSMVMRQARCSAAANNGTVPFLPVDN